MRSALVFEASDHVPDRYRLCRLAALASRKLHHPMGRMEDTVNTAFRYIARPRSVASEVPVRKPGPIKDGKLAIPTFSVPAEKYYSLIWTPSESERAIDLAS